MESKGKINRLGRKGILFIIAMLGLIHSIYAAKSWLWYVRHGSEGGYRGYRIVYDNWYWDALPTIILIVLFLIASIIVFRSVRWAILILLWASITVLSFWYYDASNQNFQGYSSWPDLGLGHMGERWDYANWPLYKHKWKNKYWGYIDKYGTFVIPPTYQKADSFSEGLAMVSIGDWRKERWGYIDKTGNVAILLKFEYAYSFSEGVAIVIPFSSEGNILIDNQGKELCNLNYDGIGNPSEGLISVRRKIHERSYGGRAFMDPNWSEDYTDESETFPQTSEHDYGFADFTGRLAIAHEYAEVEGLSEGMAAVKVKDKWGYIDKSGNIVIDLKYDNANSFHEGLAFVQIDNQWGCIDPSGAWIISPALSWRPASPFRNGYAVIKKNKKYGLIDKSGNIALEPEYDYIRNDIGHDKLAFRENKAQYLDEKLQVYLEIEIKNDYYSVGMFSEGLAVCSNMRKGGYMNKEGRIVIKQKFTDNRSFQEGLASVSILKGAIPRYVPIILTIFTGLILSSIVRKKNKGAFQNGS